MFTGQDKDSVLSYWRDAERYSATSLPDVKEKGSWRVRQSVEGSTWLWNYNRQIRPGKTAPGQDPKALTPQQATWDAWIEKRVNYDYWLSEVEAAKKNSAELGASVSPGPEPDKPGPMPSDLKAFAGDAPSFSQLVQPMFHTVTFADGTKLTYQDNINLRKKYAYYRFNEGVQSFGKKVSTMEPSDLEALFNSAGISDSEMRVMKSVSLLEGGFDSVNTYDTGYVSVGFIQFACLKDGAGSLGGVLLQMKNTYPTAFARDFHSYGIEVTNSGRLVALCPASGLEFEGADAAQKIIADKRLVAVFQHAGQKSKEFKMAQLQVAKSQYYPADEVITVKAGGRTLSGKVKEVFRTEAGMATLMDRKVNTGKLGNLNELAASLVNRYNLSSIKELSAYEYDLIRQMQYRKDYLKEMSASAPRNSGVVASRSGSRSTRSTKNGG